jgi:hypothetical protein
MVAFLPIAGGHIKLAERFVNPGMPPKPLLPQCDLTVCLQLSLSPWAGIIGTAALVQVDVLFTEIA